MKESWQISSLFSISAILVCIVTAYVYSFGMAYFLAFPAGVFSYFLAFFLSRKFNLETQPVKTWLGGLYGLLVVVLTILSLGLLFVIPMLLSNPMEFESAPYVLLTFLVGGSLLTLGIPYILGLVIGIFWARRR